MITPPSSPHRRQQRGPELPHRGVGVPQLGGRLLRRRREDEGGGGEGLAQRLGERRAVGATTATH